MNFCPECGEFVHEEECPFCGRPTRDPGHIPDSEEKMKYQIFCKKVDDTWTGLTPFGPVKLEERRHNEKSFGLYFGEKLVEVRLYKRGQQ